MKKTLLTLALTLAFASHARAENVSIYADVTYSPSEKLQLLSEYTKLSEDNKDSALGTAAWSMFRLVSGEQRTLNAVTEAVYNQSTSLFEGVNYCTAFLVTEDIALTAKHCFFRGESGPLPTVAIPFSNPTAVQNVELIDLDMDNDIAAIRVKSRNMKPMPIAQADPGFSSKVTTLGFPGAFVPGKQFKLTAMESTTYYTWIRQYLTDGRLVDKTGINGQVMQGNSGGPAINEKGEIVGVINSISPSFNITLTTNVAAMRQFLAKIGGVKGGGS